MPPSRKSSAIILGATNVIGRAIARRFAASGAGLLLADSDDAALAALAESLDGDAEKNGGTRTIAHFHCDLSRKLDIVNLPAVASSHFSRIDTIVNAALPARGGGFFATSPGDFESLLSRHVRSAFHLKQILVKAMQGEEEESAPRDRPGGAIVQLTVRQDGAAPEARLATDVIAAALEQLSRSAARTLEGGAIRVNAVALSSRSALARVADKTAGEGEKPPPESSLLDALAQNGYARRVADAVFYLSSDEARGVNGQIIAIDPASGTGRKAEGG